MNHKQKFITILIAVFLMFVLSWDVSADILFFQVDSPIGGSVWNQGKTYTIHWYTKDTSGVNFPWVWIKLLIYPQGQLNKATVIGEFPINNDSTAVSWQVPPNTASGSYVIRVQIKDTVNYPNKFGDSTPFSINPPPTQVVLPGQPGWVPPISETFSGQKITAAPTSPSVNKKKDISDAKSYAASAAQKSASASVALLAIPNVSGQWKSSIGLLYSITQQGSQFEWTVTKPSEKGQGIVKGKEVSASWKGESGSGSSTGQITAIDTTGTATQIDWKNGVRFYR